MKKLIIKKNKYVGSREHQKFVKKEHLKTFLVHFSRISILILIIGLWELVAYKNWVDPFIISSPSRIITQTKLLIESGSLALHVSTTLTETIYAFFISTAIGFVIAVLLYSANFARRVFEPYLVILNSLPKIALGPLIIIWVGVGTKSIVTMGVLICVVITTINLLNSYLEVPQEKIMLLKSMGASKFQTMWHLIFPATLPAFMATLKINLGMAWVGVIMGEYLSSKAGLGYLLVYGGQIFKLDLVMTAIIILCLLSGLMYAVLSILEKIILKKRWLNHYG